MQLILIEKYSPLDYLPCLVFLPLPKALIEAHEEQVGIVII